MPREEEEEDDGANLRFGNLKMACDIFSRSSFFWYHDIKRPDAMMILMVPTLQNIVSVGQILNQ